MNSAPWHHIPQEKYIGVEHPGVIRNIDKAIASLGGEQRLAEVITMKPSITDSMLTTRLVLIFSKSEKGSWTIFAPRGCFSPTNHVPRRHDIKYCYTDHITKENRP